ncbi:MAG: hypothetical protein QM756_38855 [Polyangiaceae bacterium]
MERRHVFHQLAVLAVGGFAQGFLGCKKTLSCVDISSLDPPDIKIRTETAKYVEKSADPNKVCSSCAQFEPAAPETCGACKIVKGPINPGGNCILWAAKQPS